LPPQVLFRICGFPSSNMKSLEQVSLKENVVNFKK